MKTITAALMIAMLAVPAARAAAPAPVKGTKELHRAESMYLMGSKEHRSKKESRVVVLIPAGMTDDDLIAVSDHYRAKLAAKEIVHVSFWDDAAAYKLFSGAIDDEDIPAGATDHLKARYEKDPFRIYGKPTHSLQLLGRGFAVRRTIDY